MGHGVGKVWEVSSSLSSLTSRQSEALWPRRPWMMQYLRRLWEVDDGTGVVPMHQRVSEMKKGAGHARLGLLPLLARCGVREREKRRVAESDWASPMRGEEEGVGALMGRAGEEREEGEMGCCGPKGEKELVALFYFLFPFLFLYFIY